MLSHGFLPNYRPLFHFYLAFRRCVISVLEFDICTFSRCRCQILRERDLVPKLQPFLSLDDVVGRTDGKLRSMFGVKRIGEGGKLSRNFSNLDALVGPLWKSENNPWRRSQINLHNKLLENLIRDTPPRNRREPWKNFRDQNPLESSEFGRHGGRLSIQFERRNLDPIICPKIPHLTAF